MFGPGGVLFLLRHEMLLIWRNFRATGKGRHVRRIIFYAAMIALLGFGGYWAARFLSEIRPEPTVLMLGAVGAVFVVLFSLMLSQALMLITESLYQRGDLDLLLSSPVPLWRVLIVRMSAIAINVGLLYLILTGAVFVWLPHFGGWAWMSFAPSVLLLTLFATAAGLILARIMFATIGPRNTRTFAQILASLIGAAFFIATQIPRLTEDETRAQAMRQLFERAVPILGNPDSPVSLPARAAFGIGADFWIWAALALVAFILSVWWYASGFAADAAAISGVGSRKRRAARAAQKMQSGVRQTLVRKEWRLLRRDPLLLSQILLPLLYFIPLFAVFGSRFGDQGFDRVSAAGFASAFVLMLTSFAASLAWLTVSAEDAPDLIASAPVSRDEIDNAKALAAAVPSVVLLLPPAIGAAIFVTPAAGFWMVIGGVAAIISTCLIAIWHQTPGSRKQFRRRTRGSLMLNFGRSFVALGWIGATGLAVSGWAIFAILPALVALGLLLALHESRPPVEERGAGL
jgi:ABC-2 type transport system permease protein